MKIVDMIEPNPQTQKVYEETYQLYRETYAALTQVFDRLAGLQARGEVDK